MSPSIFSPVTEKVSAALCSHDPLCFAAKPEVRSEMTRPAASRLFYISNWKLGTLSTCEEPNLRKLLGHLSVYDQVREFPQTQQIQSSEETPRPNELSTYLQHPVPSFREFQAAIEVQLATIAHISAAAAQLNVEEYSSDEEEDDDDCDSNDGEWSDEDTAAESDDSFTDYDSVEGQRSQCSSPTSCPDDKGGEEGDLWAIRPLTPFMNNRQVDVG
ncbi:uncharacterized protein Z518_02723 [Rhinocladiella mackenziei CBS 650.93]|uniref:Uncharacterized protein n=1 Tax=Rhinocladiella mackenziei CBS 650.93 TaxID=1442369 RepID=A0A0D2HCA8_9EURO|nr:uncharacterized protein Z518_02723 [Rhinocladiella mackenziei CBS 650.93]KIX08068.1 hypothetical protein Z518_02723 [Rhinocladiella mackenziei CBS 650.93]